MGRKLWLYGLLPVAALVLFVAVVVQFDSLRTRKDSPPPIEDLTIERVQITDHGFIVKIRADSPQPMVIAQVMVDGAYWVFSQEPIGPLRRIETALIKIDFPWVADEVHHLRFLTESGATFDHTIDIAQRSPDLSWSLIGDYALVGVLVGLVPVAFGMLFFPAIKTVGSEGLEFVLALTIGLLGYLFIDLVLEGLELSKSSSSIFGGAVLVLIPMVLTFVALEALSQEPKKQKDGVQIAILIAFGIGLHNFGEGLAIGASLSANKIAMGATLVVGFALHNITEGIGIISPLVRERVNLKLFLMLVILAGLPTVPGIWIGAFSFAQHWAAVFFGVGAGAVLHVMIAIDRFLNSLAGARFKGSRFNRTSVAGYCVGVTIMYGTASLIAV